MKVRLGVEQPNIDSFIDKIILKYHFNKKDSIDLKRLYFEILKNVDAKAVYKINNKVTGVKEIDDNQTAVVAITLGRRLDELQERYTLEQRLGEVYMIDCISDELLLCLYKEFNETYARYHRRYVKKYIFIGKEIEISRMSDILADLFEGKDRSKIADGTDEKTHADDMVTEALVLEITANEYGVLTPSKSVLFYAILSENPEERCEGICAGCNNLSCENRMVYEDNKILLTVDNTIEKKEIVINNVGLNYGFQRIFGSSK